MALRTFWVSARTSLPTPNLPPTKLEGKTRNGSHCFLEIWKDFLYRQVRQRVCWSFLTIMLMLVLCLKIPSANFVHFLFKDNLAWRMIFELLVKWCKISWCSYVVGDLVSPSERTGIHVQHGPSQLQVLGWKFHQKICKNLEPQTQRFMKNSGYFNWMISNPYQKKWNHLYRQIKKTTPPGVSWQNVCWLRSPVPALCN